MRGECFRYINKIKINIFMHSTPCFVLNISMLFIFLVHDNNRIMNHCSQYKSVFIVMQLENIIKNHSEDKVKKL